MQELYHKIVFCQEIYLYLCKICEYFHIFMHKVFKIQTFAANRDIFYQLALYKN